jgi:hypothetical protein
MKTALAVVAALVCWTAMASSASPQQTLSQKRAVLQPQLAITTATAGDLEKALAENTIEHTSEVSRSDRVTLVLTIEACQADPSGQCSASADVVTYAPDGSVHSELKGIDLSTRRATAVIAFAPDAAPGIYRAEATVRDMHARRFGKTERRFGLK